MRSPVGPGVNLLELRPERTADWREEKGLVVVQRQPPASRWRAPLEWLGYRLAVRRVRLDQEGSFAWRLLDGRRTVAEVADALRAEFGDAVEPVEERLGQLVRQLHAGGLLRYPEVTGSVPSRPR